MPDSAITAQTVLRRAKHASWSALGGEVLIVDLRDRKSHRLVGAAAFMWMRCDGRTSLGTVVDSLTAEYEVDRAQADADARALFSRLLSAGVLEVA